MILVAALVGLLVLAACSDDDPTPTPVGPTDQPTASPIPATPTPSGPKIDRLVFGFNLTVESNNPLQDQSNIDTQIQLKPMYEYLIGINAETGQFEPELALSWTPEQGGSALRFTLRQGVQFHDGWGEFTSADVIRSFDLQLEEDSLLNNARALRRTIDNIEATGTYEVLFTFKSPDAEFLLSISEITVAGEIISAAHADALGVRTSLETVPLADTGPYKFKERVQGTRLVFERHDEYWGEKADFKELEWRVIPEASSRLAALRTGEVHVAPLPEDLLSAATGAGLEVIKGTAPGFRVAIGWEGTYLDLAAGGDARIHPDAPFLDLNVRKALNKAINRDAINQAFFNGEGEIMAVAELHPLRQGWNPDWLTNFESEYGFDPAAAEALLRESGFTESNPLEARILSVPIGQLRQSQDIIETIWGYWNDLPNADIALDSGDPATFGAERRSLAMSDAAYIYATSSNTYLAIRVYNSSSPPHLGYESPELDALWAELRRELDPVRGDDLIRQWGDVAFAQHASIPLFWLPSKVVVNPEFVASYQYPGNISGTYTHMETIQGTRSRVSE
jgi:peptide/nickel transport system substrate-binding protein/oligopeptide transport system substrate-binding protein